MAVRDKPNGWRDWEPKQLRLLGLWHFLADNYGVAGFGIDASGDGLAATGYRVRVLLLGYYAVLYDFRGRRRQLTANRHRRRRGRRHSGCNRLLLGGTASQAQNRRQKKDGKESFHRAGSRATAQYNAAG